MAKTYTDLRRWCVRCAAPWTRTDRSCPNPACRAKYPQGRTSKDYIRVDDIDLLWLNDRRLNEQWGKTIMPESTTISLSANFGGGKSRLCGTLFQPDLEIEKLDGIWFTNEQEPGPVIKMLHEVGVTAEYRPSIHPMNLADPYKDLEHVMDSLTMARGSMIIVDSLTVFGPKPAVMAMNLVIRACHDHGWRAVLINQTTKAKEAAGSNLLRFIPDIVATVEQDSFNQRMLRFWKHRFGSPKSRYFTFTDTGCPIAPDFSDKIYTVEGKANALELIPGFIPGGNQRWNAFPKTVLKYAPGLLKSLCGTASALYLSPTSKHLFEETPDYHERKWLAQEHNLQMFSAKDAFDFIYDDLKENDVDPMEIIFGPPPKDKQPKDVRNDFSSSAASPQPEPKMPWD